MKIEINTNGIGTETSIKINDVEITDAKFFEFSVNVDKSNKAKLFIVRRIDGKYIPMEHWGEGLRKFDDAAEMSKGMNNGVHIGTKRQAA